MNATIIENILRALVTALPDDYFKQELERRGFVQADQQDAVPDLDSFSSKELIKELASRGDFDPQILRRVSDEDLWSAIKDKEQCTLDHLSDLADDDLWYAIDDKEQVIRENLGEVDDEDKLDSLSDPEYAISKWIGGADEYTVKRILERLNDDVLISAFSDKKSLAEQAVVSLSGDDMLDVLDRCITRALLDTL